MFRNSNLNIQWKEVTKKTLEQLLHRLFWTLKRKTCVFTGKFSAGLSKPLSTCPEEHLHSNIFERKPAKIEDFCIFFEIFGRMAKNIVQGWRNSNRSPGEPFMGKPFSKQKKSLFFPILSDFLLLAKKFGRFAKPAIYVSVEVFVEKHFLKSFSIFFKFFTLLWSFIHWTLSRKISFRVVTTAIGDSRGTFWV